MSCYPNTPDLCYARKLSGADPIVAEGEVIAIQRGVSGFFQTPFGVQSEDRVQEMNSELGVTNAQRKAMEAGSLYGWHVTMADPAYWAKN